MPSDVFSPLTISVLSDRGVVVQRNVLLALQVCDLPEFLERPVTRITRLNFSQDVETIYGVSFKLLEGDIFCWRTIISAFEGTEDSSASRCRAELGTALQTEPVGVFQV